MSETVLRDPEPASDVSRTGRSRAPHRRLRALMAPVSEDSGEAYRFVLLMRFVLVNAIAVALLAALALQGLVGAVLAADVSRLVVVIGALFVVGLVWCAHKVWCISAELNELRAARPRPTSRVGRHLAALAEVDAAGRASLEGALRLKLASRIAPIRHIAQSLVVLGLVGTVVGFVIALSGVDPQSASDPGMIAPMVSTLIQGMSVALYTTLVGAVLNLWLMVDYRLLEGGTVRLFTAIVERGARIPAGGSRGGGVGSIGDGHGH